MHQSDSTYVELASIAAKKEEAGRVEIVNRKDILNRNLHRLESNPHETAAAVLDELISQLGGI